MKLGYQDAGSWTFLKNTPSKRMKAAWLYAQFVVSKTVSLKKTLVGLTPIRLSDIQSDELTSRAKYLGGLVEFYRSRGRDIWTPTGTNVPDYTSLSNYWWQFVGRAVSGELTIDQTMNRMAGAFDATLDRLGREWDSPCSPNLAPKRPYAFWIEQPGSPKPVLTKPVKGETLPYQEAIRVWD